MSALEHLLFGGRNSTAVTDLDGVVTSTSPYRVQCTGEDKPGEVIPLVAKAAAGDAVIVLCIGRRRLAFPVTWNDATIAGISLAKLTTGELSAGVRDSLRTQLAVPSPPTDTGWTQLPLAAGITGTAWWRIKSGMVHLHGAVTRTAGNFPAGWTSLLTLPTAASPSLPAGEGLAYKSMSNNTNITMIGYVGSNGVVSVGQAASNRVDVSTITPWSVA